MPICYPANKTAFNIVRCGYIELGVRDLQKSRNFYIDILGLIETQEKDGSIYLRGLEERCHHSVVLTKSESSCVLRMGFQVENEHHLSLLHADLQQTNLYSNFTSAYGVERILQTVDPLGMPIEFYTSMSQVSRSLQKYGSYKGCRPMRLDHFNCFTPDVQKSHDFYSGQLGFHLTEYTETDSENPELWAVWMQRKGNVHDLALTNGVGPRLHHLAFWCPAVTDIIHLCDVMSTTGYLKNMERGPGRHGISNAFFLYVRDPDGHRIELYSSDYLTVDPDFVPIRWGLHDAQRQTLWGHAAPKSWFEEGSHFINTTTSEPQLQAQPIVAN
ncbi:3,4-dihydroxyphenylacetate 2,3-dioxygenase [Candidatus Uabimicrobium amorphum]|uniref:3,4-dihydroxyphenylacetate 2,3-dioxygenase n=1 Tax=Uabimicrobium amorphum TaxID=2596890 RepID=A0A5S9IUE6_UABAM|nr:3,4-dihydroxyphenylacetate 2,3-dioxygenase [Candidatus Uabimicrobium amorphum]BBM87562.1 3,4-dihydroxyphenylacetate 2,3-dioxygenase [Candidatus Uabimicrobium amorphum]